MSKIAALANALALASEDRKRLRKESLKILRNIKQFDSEDEHEERKFRRGYAADLVDDRIINLLWKYEYRLMEGE